MFPVFLNVLSGFSTSLARVDTHASARTIGRPSFVSFCSNLQIIGCATSLTRRQLELALRALHRSHTHVVCARSLTLPLALVSQRGTRSYARCAMEPDGAERDDGASSMSSRTLARASYSHVMELPVMWEGVTERMCSCCGQSSHSDSPFEDAAPDDRFGGKRPWHRYVASPAAPTEYKVVVGKLCMICHQVFKILGLHLTHGTMPSYLTFVTPKPEEHRAFLRSVKNVSNDGQSGDRR